MEIYITFGQIHRHEIDGQVFDKDCVAIIECNDYEHGRKIAFDAFGDKYCFSYETFERQKLKYFPRGFIRLEETKVD